MSEIKRVKIDSIIESQIPEFLIEESPLFVEFLKQYYQSLEHQSGAIDLAINVKKYKDISQFNKLNLTESTKLTKNILKFDTSINVISTDGWPSTYGLLKIDNEIITYTSKTNTTFEGCIRGFSGIDAINSIKNSEFLNFVSTSSEEHLENSIVLNLSNLFLLKFFEKFKSEFFPGFEDRDFNEEISIENVLTSARDFYSSKGTDSSYKLLFKVLFGTDVEVIKPQDYTLIPSSNPYFTTKNILVEKISGGNPTDIRGNFLYQNLTGIGTVSASIYNIEYRPVDKKQFYEISLDSTSFSGNFEVSGKTKLLEDTPIGSNTVLVDSTIGFSKTGKILVKPENSDFIELSYTDITTNQFLGVTGITKNLTFGLDVIEEKFAFSYIGIGNTSEVKFRVINVIDKVDFSKTKSLRINDKVKLSGFGKNLADEVSSNNWIYNIPTEHNVKSLSQVANNRYRIILFDEISFYQNENIILVDQNNNFSDASILSVEYNSSDKIRKYTNRILVQSGLSASFDLTRIKSIRKKIYKSNHYSNYFPEVTSIPAGIQNTYVDSKHENFYVTSTGLPNYPIFSTDNKQIISTQSPSLSLLPQTFGSGITSIFYVQNHQLINGDFIYYNSFTPESGISTGYYYVTKIDSNSIKLSYSKSDIFSKKYITSNSDISSDTIVKAGFENKILRNQKILKKFPLQKQSTLFDDINKRKTTNRPIGLLVNGVEILSPTLFDENIYYGAIQSIEVINSGKNYDIVNTPSIEIKDEVGSSVKAHLNLSGSIKKVKIISAGVGYKEKPKITISGGNGKGCALDCNLVSSRLRFGFKADINVNSVDNTITFLENVLFENGEEIIYDSNTNNDVPGLVNGSRYFIGFVTPTKLKIYNTQQDALNSTNVIDITGTSSGFHYFSSLKNKNTITEVYVKDPGEGYSNRTIKVPSILSADNRTLGINTFDSYFFARKHGFLDGELVQYSTTGTVISGLSTSIYYYVGVIDDNKFRLAPAGIGTTQTNVLFLEKRFVKFNNLGVGTHSVSYPPIKISVETISAIGSTTIIKPILEPLVLGSINDVYVEDGGVGFGCTDIINFHRRPNVGISSIKSEAILQPIIINGNIVDVKIINKGRGYRKDSDIIISGKGSFAEIDPIIDSNGRLSAVNILRGGIGYGVSTTQLTLQNRGLDAKFLANVTEWKINQVVKLKNQISVNDDGVLYPNKNVNLGLQFVNFYIPKKLRYQLSDNFTETDKETSGTLIHSPILGFAYDGNPIYGPYGFNSTLGGFVRQMKSSYILNLNTNESLRPPLFEPGYFVNDFTYNGSGDLDENNGRFCITPQYPDGTYAYFYSISVDAAKRSTPSYPYVVANSFYNTPVEENFLPKYNQDLNIFTNDLTRNIAPYYLDKQNSFYNLIDKVVDEYKQEFRILDIQSSVIDDVVIFSAGQDYKVEDDIILNNENTFGNGANLVISEIEGKKISGLTILKNKLDNVSFVIRSNNITGVVDYPHQIRNNEVVSISGISTITSSGLSGRRSVKVTQKSVQLLKNIDVVANTGISTIIFVKDVSGFRVNDTVAIGTEKLLITRISPERSGFYVNRIENTGIHTAGLDTVDLLPKRFELNLKEPLSDYTFENTVTFFDPKESVGTGTAGVSRNVVGLGTSSFVSIFLPSKSIYIPGHSFFTGQELIYNCGLGGTSLYVNNVGSGQSFSLQQNQKVYAVNLGKNYVGLSTLGFTTSSGIGTNLNSLEFWPLTEAFGVVGSAHSLSTTNKKITGTIITSSGIVTTNVSHGLVTGDEVSISLSSSIENEIKIKFDQINRKLLVNEISFSDSNVSISNNTINLSSYVNEIKNGDKVTYFASTPIGGLANGATYYVLKEDDDKIKLCLYESDTKTNSGSQKNVIDFTTVGSASQTLYFVNPPLKFIKGDKIKFNLSDPSLLNMDIKFYSDTFYSKRLDIIGNNINGFAIVNSGTPGTNDAYVTLDTSNKNFPTILYYNLIFKSPIEESKTQLSSDYSVPGNNQIIVRNHPLNRKVGITTISNTEFTFLLDTKFSFNELTSVLSSNSSYKTTSTSAIGPISNVKINFAGRGYKKLPFIQKIDTKLGKNAILKLKSEKIGRVESYERVKDGFDYPTDPTLSPRLSVPVICGIKDIRTISNIGIITGGRNYNGPPELLVKDDPSIKLSCSVTGGAISKVNIINNSTSLSSPLEIIPIRNSNGYEIDNITYAGNFVTLELNNTPGLNPFVTIGYGNTLVAYPFAVGDKIFIENCRLTSSTRDKANFNSSSYNYRFFTVTGISSLNNTVTYSMSGISTGQFGTYNDEFNLGTVINQKDLPVFQMNLADDVSYQSSEKVISSDFTATVMENGWDNNLNQLRMNDGYGTLQVGDYLYGERSKINGKVDYFDTFDLKSTLGVFRDKVASVDSSVGILNDFQQRISDNFYYQKFSYSLKSDISYDKWRESVRSIVHPSGFKEFSDLVIYTNPTNIGYAKSTNMRVKLKGSDSTLSINVDNEVSMYDKFNFAKVYEDQTLDDGSVESVYFTEGINLRPFIINKTNKVLRIDDISEQFNGSSLQNLDGRYADASDLIDLNKEFIQAEVVAFVEFNYPDIVLSSTYSAEKCKRDVGYIVDAVSHDIKYNSNDKSVEAGLAYWNAGASYVVNETEQTLFAYNYVKFLGQYVINNQTPPTLYQSLVPQEFDFEIIQDPLNLSVIGLKNARNLIVSNRREIQDKSLASVAVGFPDFYFPPDPQTTFRSRYADGYRLIQQNRQEIVDTSWNDTVSIYPGISTTQNKCKRDIGYFIDAISIDVFLGGNSYTKQFILQYFNQGSPIPNGLAGEEAQSIFAFVAARNLMRSAVRNGLTIQDLTVTPGPPVYGIGAIVGVTSTAACTDVQNNISTLVGIVTASISIGSTSNLPATNVGTYTSGQSKCFRDLGYIIDGVAQDISYGTNQHTLYNTKKYFTGAGVPLNSGLVGEESESIYAFETAKSLMKKAITNQLNVKNLTIAVDPITGFNTDPNSYAGIQTNINTLVGILTVAIGNSSLAGIPTENYGTADCADVRTSLGNYVGIITTIIGLGPSFAPIVVLPSISRGGGIVGVSSFKLKNKGTSLFSHTIVSSASTYIDLESNKFIIPNHNFQTGHELIYEYSGGNPIGIATTSYILGNKTEVMVVGNINGTAILQQGYDVSISTSITGISTVLSPVGPSLKQYTQVIGVGTTSGVNATFNVLITYSPSTGQPLSTSITLKSGGTGYKVGQIVSIAGTYMGGSTPANNLSFVVSNTGPSGIQTQANNTYTNVPSTDLSGALFNVTRNDSGGYVSNVQVTNPAAGYASTSIISIAGTYIGGSTNDFITFTPLELGASKLPESLFVYKLNDNEFKVFGLSTSSRFLDFTGFGTGYHTLSHKDPNASVIITLDGVIQTAIRRKSLSVSLASNVSTANTTILNVSSGISSLNTYDILNLNNEFILVKSIGISSSNSIFVERGYLGTTAGVHTVGVSATVLTGDFNIVKDTIFFTTAPYGKIGPAGLSTGSIFGGRVFSRQFNAATPQDKNILLDDISLSFTGIAATEFTIKSNGQNTTTLFNNINSGSNINNNPFILINNVPQVPQSDFTIDNDSQNVLKFLSGTPSSGRISKVAITTGFGYQPRIGAAATVVVSASGTISSIVIAQGGLGYRQSPSVSISSTIGFGASITATVGVSGTITGFIIVNPGTGYTRSSIPKINVGIPTGYSNLPVVYTGGTSGVGQKAKITVEVGSGSSIIDFKIDSPGIGYKVGDKLKVVGIATNINMRNDILTINNVLYDNTTGVTTIRTLQSHLLKVGDSIRLSGIALTCGYDEVGIRTFSYDNVTGISTIVTYSPHGLLRTDVPNNETSDEVFLYNLPFICPSYTTNAAVNISNVVYNHIAGIATITTSSDHGAVTGKQVKLAGIAFSCAAHSATGIATYNITNFVYTNSTGITTITLDANHELIPGEYVQLSDIILSCPSEAIGYSTTKFPYSAGIGTLGNSYPNSSPNTLGGTFNVFRVLVGTSGTTIVFYAGISTVAHTYSSGGTATVGITSTIFPYPGSSPTAVSGTFDVFKVNSVLSNTQFTIIAGVSSIAHTYVSGGTAQSGVTTTIFPDGTSTYGKVFPVLTSLGSTSFTINSGISTIPHTFVGWPEIGITTFKYTNTTGIATATTSSNHNYLIGDKVTLEDLSLTCPGYVQNPIVNITNLIYDKVSGIATITTASNHLAITGKQIKLAGIALTCPSGSGITSTIFPYPGSSQNTLSNWDIFKVNSVLSQTQFTINVGVSSITHTYVSGGTAQAGITSTIFPYPGSSIYGYTFTVIGITTNTFTFNAGISTIVHDYVSGGKTKKAATVQRVLRYTDDSSDGAYDFQVTGIPDTVGLGSTNVFTILSGITTIPHFYTQSGIVSFRQPEDLILTVQEIQTDKFSGFYPGQFIIFDDISENFNGFRKKFTLSAMINGVKQVLSLKTPVGSDLDITNNIFIYINNVIQNPLDSYTFQGSRVIFKEAPRKNSKCSILYYRGSSIDVEEIEPPKTIKVGDSLVIQENRDDLYDISQFERTVKKIVSSDQLDTFTYGSIGIITDSSKERPLTWKKQKQDKIITGSLFAKSRPNLQSNIRPNATIIKSISPEDTSIYVDNAFPIFAGTDNLVEDLRNLFIVENRTTEAAEATSTVSVASTISSITVTSPGVGYAYTTSPYVNISLSAISIKDPIYEWNTVTGISGLSTTSQLNSLSFGERIISVGNSSLYVISADGSEWEVGNIGLGSTTNFNSVYSASVGYGNSNTILAVGSFGKIGKATGYATTISSWTQLNLVEELSIPGYGALLQQSSSYNGTLKEIVYNPLPNTWVTVGTAGSIFVGSGIHTNTFVNRYSRTIKDLNSIAFGNGYFVAVGNDGTILTSNTGLFWELEPSPTSNNLNKVTFDGSNFIIAANNGAILKSISRSSYEFITTNLYGLTNFVNIKYNYGFYVAITSSGDLYYSFNLSTWVIRNYVGTNNIKDLSFEESLGTNGKYIAVGAASTVIYAEPVFHRAVAQSSVTSGLVTSIVIIDGGFGYLQNSPPAVMIEPDVFRSETIKSFKAVGDHGIIIGINTFISGTPGIGTTSPKIEFVLQSETYDNNTLGIGYSSLNTFGISNSQLQKGDYFVITDSNVSTGGDLVGITTLLGGMSNYPNSRIGTAKSFIDGVYIADNVTTPNLGIVTVTCHFAPMVDNYVKVYKRGPNNTGVGTNNFYGRYSWGKIYDYQNRALSLTGAESFETYTNNGLVGLSTSAKIFRTRGLLSN